VACETKLLQSMIGFRNVLLHEYRKLDLNIMVDVIENRIRQLLDFADIALSIDP
jgi:uncharacterized protein YutE (UPF0331/DUF86 family)